MANVQSDAWFGSSALKVSQNRRIYAVGDVHGRIDLLRAIVARIDEDILTFDDSRIPVIVFLGDYIDRGDAAREVLDYLMELECMRPGNCVFLRGNHEAALIDFVDDPIAGKAWLDWGGTQTIASFGIAPPQGIPHDDELMRLHEALLPKLSGYLPFLKLLKPYHTSGELIFAHASLEADLTLEQQPMSALLWGRTPNGKSRTIPGHRLVHGHFASDEPISTLEYICVDTGAYYSGKLTAVRLDDLEHYIFANTGDFAGT